MANGTINAIQYFIRVKDSLNELAHVPAQIKKFSLL